MTYKQFLRALVLLTKEQEIKWRFVGRDREIRCKEDTCPLGLVSDPESSDYVPTEELAVDAIGIDRLEARQIADAADFKRTHWPNVRRDLLAACGLKERKRA